MVSKSCSSSTSEQRFRFSWARRRQARSDGRVDAFAAAAVTQVGRLRAHGRFYRVDALELVGDPPCLRLLTTSLSCPRP